MARPMHGFCPWFAENYQRHDCIHVVVNHYSKMVQFIPCLRTKDVAWLLNSSSRNTYQKKKKKKLFFKGIVRLHDFPKLDGRSMSYFWWTLWKIPNAKLKFSFSFHPKKNGQIEVVNWSLDHLLHCLAGDQINGRICK